MVNSNSRFEDELIRWIFTDANSKQVRDTLECLHRAYRFKRVSEELYNHYSFMLNIKLKKFKLIETLDR